MGIRFNAEKQDIGGRIRLNAQLSCMGGCYQPK